MKVEQPLRGGPSLDVDAVLAEACQRAGIPAGRRRLLRHFANAVYLLEDVPIVARVAYGHGARSRSRTGAAVAHWLGRVDFPASAPALLGGQEPLVVEVGDAGAVSFWHYYPQPISAEPHDLRVLGETARHLHTLNAVPPIPLESFQPLRSITATVQRAEELGTLAHDTLRWFNNRIEQLLGEYHALDFPLGVGLIHADMYAGNLLWNARPSPATVDGSTIVLGDWDSICIGPREIDLAPTFMSTRFGLDEASVERFIAGYGHDLRNWEGYPTLRAMRELSTLTALIRLSPTQTAAAGELQHRLATLRSGDTSVRWTRH